MTGQVNDLIGELERLGALHRQLVGAVKDKLAAMRTADPGAIDRAGRREQQLISAIQGHEERRRTICDELAAGLGLPQEAGYRMTDLAGHLAEPYASRVLSLAASIRQSMGEVQHANRINQVVAEQVQRCFGDALAAISDAGMDSGTYGRSGRRARPAGVPLFSATG